MKKDNFEKINEKYILSQLGEKIIPASHDRTLIWKEIIEHELKK